VDQAFMKSRKPFPWHIVVFLFPAVLIYTVFMIYPLIDSLRFSLYTPSAQPPNTREFVGLKNYVTLFTDPNWVPRLWGAIKNNFIFFAIHMLVQNPLGLLLAALLSTRIGGAAIYRTLIFTPTVLSVVLIGFVWQLILSPLWGIPKTFASFFGVKLAGSSMWTKLLGLEETALITLSLISVWQWVGVPMLLFLAAITGIPDELIEAAKVDGATAWKVFWNIKFPLILPTVGIVAVLTFVGNFNAFDLIYSTQKAIAGPNFSTDLLGTFFYRTFFGFQLQPGNAAMGATIAGVMLLIILAGVLLYLFGYQRRLQRIEL
jgi:raffinose/stachyose/melibiose transport system permease protein